MTENTITLIAIAVAAVAQVILQVLSRFDAARAAQKVADKVEQVKTETVKNRAETASKVEEVKTTLAETVQVVGSKLTDVHDLVNGQKAALLVEIATLKQQVADLIKTARK